MNIEYPYYRLHKEFNKKRLLRYVKKYKPKIYTENKKFIKYNIEKFEDIYFVIQDIFEETKHINNITDYFTEKVRVKCKFGNHPSPFEYWTMNKKYIIEKTKKKYNKINIYNLREIIFENTKLCNNFRITVALTILKYFKPNKYLDISAGWGDRLIASILYKIKLYVSCDPNLELHEYYDEIIDKISNEKRKKNYIIYKNGFLESPIIDKDFDIVFSSPPFFDLEKYSKCSQDSLTKFRTEKEWNDNFFIPSLIKSYNLLKLNGHMILYMGGSKFIMDSMHKLDKIMKYKGQIYFYDTKLRGIYVWEKINNIYINLI
jgi:hypothetical protein